MVNSCVLKKRCSICGRVKHNNEFYSNGRGRVKIKSYCLSCKRVYGAIKESLIEAKMYKNLDFDTSKLIPDQSGYIIELIEETSSYKKIQKEEAIRKVEQGAAHVTSPSTIQNIIRVVTGEKNLRKFVMERDKYKCFYCNEPGDTIDHVIPQTQGGLDTPMNLVCSCVDCNREKGSLSKSEFIKMRKSGLSKKNNEDKKKCKSCLRTLRNSMFDKSRTVCKKCTPYYLLLEKQILTPEKINYFSATPDILKKGEILLSDLDNVIFARMKYDNCIFFLKKGIISVVSERVVRMTVELDDLLDNIPILFKEFTDKIISIKEGENSSEQTPIKEEKIVKKQIKVKKKKSKKKKQGSQTFEELLIGPVVGCVSHNNKARKSKGIPKKKAQELVLSGLAEIVKRNRIRLIEENESKENVSFIDLTGSNIGYLDKNNKSLGNGSINLKLAKVLVSRELAVIVKKNRIKLTKTVGEVNEILPETKQFNQRKIKNQECLKLLNGSSIAYMDVKNSPIGSGNITKNEARKLVLDGLAEVIKVNRIKLTKSLDIVEKRHPQIRKYSKRKTFQTNWFKNILSAFAMLYNMSKMK